MESSQTLNTCIANLTNALMREAKRLPKVVMEFKIASNAKEIMNISLQDLFGSGDRLPEYVKSLKASLSEMGSRQYAKPTGLVWKRLESRYSKHKALLADARESAISLNNLFIYS